MKLLTSTEAAERLGITREGLHKIVRRGEIEPAERRQAHTGQTLLYFAPADVTALKRQRAKNPPKPGRKPTGG